ncbi:MAG: thioredoxin domain-containing protein [Niabella sp.]
MMKRFMIMATAAIVLGSCNLDEPQTTASGAVPQSATNFLLSALAFSDKINAISQATIIDVRTAEEFATGHLAAAKNMNIDDPDFESSIKTFDKTKPVFVYCLSGGRSAAAVRIMRLEGFKDVYDLQGGLMAWRAANLPVSSGEVQAMEQGMSMQQFTQFTSSKKPVLVDFYADWCAPCKRMEPYISEMLVTMKEELTVLRINADENPQLCSTLGINSLPYLQLYKNNQVAWSNKGYISKEDLLKAIQ